MKEIKKEITVYIGEHGQKPDDKLGNHGDLFIESRDYNLAVYCKTTFHWKWVEVYTMGAYKALEKDWMIEL